MDTVAEFFTFILDLLSNLEQILKFVWDTLSSIPSLIQSVLFFLPSGVSVMFGTVFSVLVLIAFIRYVKGVK